MCTVSFMSSICVIYMWCLCSECVVCVLCVCVFVVLLGVCVCYFSVFVRGVCKMCVWYNCGVCFCGVYGI